MIEPGEAIEVLDWILAAACVQASATRHPRPSVLDDALALHFAWLRSRAPLTHLALRALLAEDEPGSDNLALWRLAGPRAEVA